MTIQGQGPHKTLFDGLTMRVRQQSAEALAASRAAMKPSPARASKAVALPTEIALNILAHLPLCDVMALKAVSRSWYAVATRRLDDLSATLAHRPWKGAAGLQRMLGERQAMEVSLFAPHGVPSTRAQAEAIALKAYTNDYHATALVAWQAAGHISAENLHSRPARCERTRRHCHASLSECAQHSKLRSSPRLGCLHDLTRA